MTTWIFLIQSHDGKGNSGKYDVVKSGEACFECL